MALQGPVYGGCRQKAGRRPEGLGGTVGQLRGWPSQLGYKVSKWNPRVWKQRMVSGGSDGEESLNCEPPLEDLHSEALLLVLLGVKMTW